MLAHAEMFSASTVSLLLFLIIKAQAQECVQNLPRFVNQGLYNVERLESGTQVIIPEYSFDCYGNVTHWGAYVRNRNGIYSLDFQVWRRSGGGQGTTACYKLVGNNHFSSIRPAQRSRGQILEPIPVEQQIEVCPGDVIGFYVQNTTRANSGVQLQQQDTDDEEEDEDEEDSSSNISFRRHVVVTAWYGSVSTSVAATESRMLRVGRNNGYDLRSSTTAAPIITASVVVFTPSPSQTLSPSTSTFPSSLTESALVTTSTPLLVITQTGTSQTGTSRTGTLQRTEILQTLAQFSTLSTPQPSSILSPSLLSEELELELGVMVPTVIVALIVLVLGVLTVVFILTMARRRMAKKQVQMVKSLDNAEYSEHTSVSHMNSTGLDASLEHFEMNTNDAYGTNTTEIATTGNVAYTTAEDTIPATQNVAYGQVHPGTDECYDYVICD